MRPIEVLAISASPRKRGNTAFILLNLDKRENEIVDGDRETETPEVKERSSEHER